MGTKGKVSEKDNSICAGKAVGLKFHSSSLSDPSLFRYSMLPAISLSGLIFSHIKLGRFNGHNFVTALKELVSMMNPYPSPNSILVMDNDAIHHVSEVEKICTDWFDLFTFI